MLLRVRCSISPDLCLMRLVSAIHTPSCIWRRTGEIQKANQEFANLTGIPASLFRNGLLCVYELMDEDSAVRYWEGYAKIAFDAGKMSTLLAAFLLNEIMNRTEISVYLVHPESALVSYTSSPASETLSALFDCRQIGSCRVSSQRAGSGIAAVPRDRSWRMERRCIPGDRSPRDDL